jgi:hypothetical protein
LILKDSKSIKKDEKESIIKKDKVDKFVKKTIEPRETRRGRGAEANEPSTLKVTSPVVKRDNFKKSKAVVSEVIEQPPLKEKKPKFVPVFEPRNSRSSRGAPSVAEISSKVDQIKKTGLNIKKGSVVL